MREYENHLTQRAVEGLSGGASPCDRHRSECAHDADDKIRGSVMSKWWTGAVPKKNCGASRAGGSEKVFLSNTYTQNSSQSW